MDNISWTEIDMQNYIKASIPGISYEDIWEIRCKFVYDNVPLDAAIAQYALKQKFKEWNKRKDKSYYKITKTNGTVKYMYACEEHVKYMCECDGYTYQKVS